MLLRFVSRYHDILGVPPDAGKVEITRAYRALARKYHPDVNPDPGAAEQFIRITEAYEVLLHRKQARRKINLNTSTRREQAEAQAAARKEARRRAAEQARKRYKEFKEEQERAQSKAYSQAIQVFLLLIVAGALGWLGHSQWVAYQISQSPRQASCTVTFVGFRELHYAWAVGDSIWRGVGRANKSSFEIVGGNGMPLQVGDRFTLVYQADDPSHHYIEYRQTDWQTMQRYLNLLVEQVVMEEEKKGTDTRGITSRARCFVLLLFESQGVDGLAAYHFRHENPFENLRNNWVSNWLFRREVAFDELKKRCGLSASDEV